MAVAQGEVVGLLGPNGAGKTTLIRLLLGLIVPSEGAIDVLGHRVRRGVPSIHNVGSLVGQPAFYPHLSGAQNLLHFGALRASPTSRRELFASMEEMSLDPALTAPVREYSTGMRQRLALALAFARAPRLLLLDEPTDGLDPAGIVDVRRSISEFADRGATVLLSSHLLAEVERVCGRIIIMSNGRVVRDGRTDRIIEQPMHFRVMFPNREACARARAILTNALAPVAGSKSDLAVVVPADGVSIQSIVQKLSDASIEITSIAAEESPLEALFLDVTGIARERRGQLP